MKLLYVVPMLYEEGGIQQFAKNEQMSLRRSYNINLSDWYSPTRLRDELVYRRIPKSLARKLFENRHKGDFNHSQSLDKLMSYDLVHYWIVDASMAFPDKPGIISCHGIEILTSYVRHHRKRKFIEALNHAKAIHACSSFTKKYLSTNYAINPNKITVINPSIDLELFKFNETPTNKKFHIGTLARFVKRKNIPNIIKALEILQNRFGDNFIYYLAGDGPERRHILHALKRSAIHYKYFGKISEADKINNFYSSLDLFVLPPLQTATDIEGFGIVFLEANASGVPVVAADTGGVSDAVSPGISGEFADPTDPEDIAEKIHHILISTKDYRTSARQWAGNFSQENTVKRFQKLYDGVAKSL
jgi:glycosyltransferase involved in cell wall biosynthesis